MKPKRVTICLISLFLLSFVLQGVGVAASQGKYALLDYTQVTAQIDTSRIFSHIVNFSSFSSRYTGTPGFYEAGEYIYNHFVALGLSDIKMEPFDVITLVDDCATLTILSPEKLEIEIHPLQPNGIAPVITSPSGITGSLVYVGSDFSSVSQSINGSIVIMGANTRYQWLEALDYGAKAVIFVESSDLSRMEAILLRLKREPLSFPRFYITQKEMVKIASLLDEGNVICNVKASTGWKEMPAYNVLGEIKGTTYPDSYYIITAYYDSSSIVPSISPGAQEAVSVATLLELARFFMHNPPKYSILFIAYAAHWQGTMGARVQDLKFSFQSDFWKNITYQVNLFLTTETDIVAFTLTGAWYLAAASTGGGLADPYTRLIPEMKAIYEEVGRQTGQPFEVPILGFSVGWQGYGDLDYGQRFFQLYMPSLDHEAMMTSDGAPSLSLVTCYGALEDFFSPTDTPVNIDLRNLRKQLLLVYSWVYSLVNTKIDWGGWVGPLWEEQRFDEAIIKGRYLNAAGAYNMTGRVVEWNFTSGFYSPVPDCLILVSTIPSGGTIDNDPFVVRTDENGEFNIPNMPFAGIGGESERFGMLLKPYKLGENGEIMYAPDKGQFSIRRMGCHGSDNSENYMPPVWISVMPCGSIVVTDLASFALGPATAASVNVFETHTSPFQYSTELAWTMGPEDPNIQIYFVPPDNSYELIYPHPGAPTNPYAILANTSTDYPNGCGYQIKHGQQLVLTHSTFQMAKDFLWLNLERSSRLEAAGGEKVEMYQILEAIQSVQEAIDNGQYDPARAMSLKLLALSYDLNAKLRSTNTDIIMAVPLYAALLIPFAFLAERLFFHHKELTKRLMSILGSFMVIFLLLYFSHPGFQLTFNSAILIIGFLTITLISPIILIVLQNVYEFIMSMRTREIVSHKSGISRSAASVSALNIGVENMRKSRLRTSLTTVSVIIIIVSVVLLTSFRPVSRFVGQTKDSIAPYNGIMITSFSIGEGDATRNLYSWPLRSYVESEWEICPRSWVYPPQGGMNMLGALRFEGKVVDFPVMMGVNARESDFTNMNLAILEGGRFFLPTDKYACILPQEMSNRLGAQVDDIVRIYGIPFRVVGIMDENIYRFLTDLDGEMLTPLDTVTYVAHYDPSRIIWIPYETSLLIRSVTEPLGTKGPYSVSVSLLIRDSAQILNTTADIAETYYDVLVYQGLDEKITLYTSAFSQTAFGIQSLLVPIIIICLILFNQMMGNIYERRRTIYIMNVVGMAPLHIIFYFLAEGVIYSVLGSMIGYAAATVLAKTTALSVFFNFGSTYVAMTLILAIAIIMVSTIPPTLLSIRKTAPSGRVTWEWSTKPLHNKWEIPLPFVADTPDLALGTLAFLCEFFKTHMSPVAGDFYVLSEPEKSTLQTDAGTGFSLYALIKLPPYDMNFVQGTNLSFMREFGEERYSMTALLTLESGNSTDWMRLNKRYVGLMRKQFLIWRALPKEEKEKYTGEGRELYR